MGRLGCGQNIVYVQERGGGTIIGELPYTSLTYGRELDEISSARLTVGPEGWADGDCCDLLNTIEDWRHELAVYRDGEEAWVGALLEPEFSDTAAEIQARDLFEVLERRTLPTNREFVQTPLGEIFGAVALDALGQDTSPNIEIQIASTAAKGDRAYFAAQYRRAADELRELARSAVDYTMIRRTLRGGSEEIPVATLPVLGRDTLLEPRARYRGLQMATQVTVIGSVVDDPEAPITGVAGGTDERYGLLQHTIREPSILDTTSAAAAAQSRHEFMRIPPLFVTGVLSEEYSASFAELIPGAKIAVRMSVGCRQIDADLRLRRVSVSVGEKNLERVSVELEPVGLEAAS